MAEEIRGLSSATQGKGSHQLTHREVSAEGGVAIGGVTVALAEQGYLGKERILIGQGPMSPYMIPR
jgi:hypothetical protein